MDPASVSMLRFCGLVLLLIECLYSIVTRKLVSRVPRMQPIRSTFNYAWFFSIADVICEELKSPANVGITYDKSDWPLLPGTVAVYSCQENYELEGTDKRTCTVNGSWAGLQPKCIGIVQSLLPSMQ